jgi:hypothetical protein
MSENPIFKVLCFVWNAAGLRICETETTHIQKKARDKNFFSLLLEGKSISEEGNSCVEPQFFDAIEQAIYIKKPDIVVFVTEDEALDQTYFHERFLPENMDKLRSEESGGHDQFLLVTDPQILENVGMTYGKFDIEDTQGRKLTMKPSGTALRVSVYAGEHKFSDRVDKNAWQIEYENKYSGNEIDTQGNRHSGTIYSCFKISKLINGKKLFITRLMIIAVSLGDNIEDIVPQSDCQRKKQPLSNKEKRRIAKSANNLTLIKFLDKVDKKICDLQGIEVPNTILLGDFAYNIQAKKTTDQETIDEFLEAIQEYPLLGYEEWATNLNFNYRLLRKREKECFSKLDNYKNEPKNVNCYVVPNQPENEIEYGLHDRIIYKKNDASVIYCDHYGEIDYTGINMSTHAATLGHYNISIIK